MQIIAQTAVTMSSTELLSLVNDARDSSGEKPIRNADFLEKVADELDGEHYGKSVVQNSNKTHTWIFHLTHEQCMQVSMRESKAVRRKVVARLRDLESRDQFKIPKTLPEALRLAADLSDQVQLQQQQLAIAAPKVEALDRIATADGLLCITSAAKHLQVRPKDLFALLQERQWIYRRAGGGGFLGYQPRIQQGLLEHKVTVVSRTDGSEKVTEQVLVTGKGMAKLALMLEGVAA